MIVVHYQPNPAGTAALEHALAEAQRRDEPVSVVASGASDHRTSPSYISDDQLDQLQAALDASGIQHDVQRALDDTDPARDVLNRAEELGAALIVTGIHNRSSVGKLLMGSNVQRILLEAPCPVLSVHARG